MNVSTWYGKRAVLLAVFVVALVARVFFAVTFDGKPGGLGARHPGTLAHAGVVDASRILGGDLLLRQSSRSTCSDRSLLGAPAHPYVLAGFLGSTGGSILAVTVLYAAVGAASVLLLAAVSGHAFGSAAGAASGALAAVLGPRIAYDIQLLGDGPALAASMAGILAVLHACIGGSRRWAFGGGGLLVLAALLHEPSAVTALVVALWLAARWREEEALRPVILAVALGALLVAGPLVLRERVAGSPLPLSCATGGEAGEAPGGALLSVRAAWTDVELPDRDVGYEYLVQRAPALSAFPRFAFVALLGLAGCVCARRRAGRASASQGLVFALLAAHAALAMGTGPTGRSRAVLASILLLPAGLALAECTAAFVLGQWNSAGRWLLLMGSARLAFVCAPTAPAHHAAALTLAPYVADASVLSVRGLPTEGRELLVVAGNTLRQRAHTLEEADQAWIAALRARVGVLLATGHVEAAREDWELLRQLLPMDPLVRRAEKELGRVP